jgi:hypothetical protein
MSGPGRQLGYDIRGVEPRGRRPVRASSVGRSEGPGMPDEPRTGRQRLARAR